MTGSNRGVSTEVRVAFHQRLQAIDFKVIELFALMTEDLEVVTKAVLNRDAGASALAHGGIDLDRLHAALMAELASGEMSLPITMDMTLVARFYERLGDHAVNIARRVVHLAGRPHGN